ncbi:hypothetical protein SAMN05444277_111110 [Parafilimonas terrae]|jgi:hypothetical protein|uniref:Uncharacterized protein n=1 Tax=Parafilimonas terrae TaxID=1465490 RepID=A0A1I5YCE6_9BACT|nr:hypothetical protein SAMN05444277_111110 [Parafilimonas terrae]
MNGKKIRIFKTFQEQEIHHLQWMINSTPKERFSALLKMQQLTNKFKKNIPAKRTIIIHNGSAQ